jgi:hypothetical protein
MAPPTFPARCRPRALVLHIRGLVEVDHDTSIRIARLVLQAMAAQRAVDLRNQYLRDQHPQDQHPQDNDDYDDCA